MKKKILVLQGDGIGPEVVAQAIKVIKAINSAFGHEFILDYDLIGASAIAKIGTPIAQETIVKGMSSDAIILGAIGDPKFDNNPNVLIRPEQGLLKLRKSLGLFANLRPVATHQQLFDASPIKNKLLNGVDILIYRELTGGIYFGEKTLSEDKQTAFDGCSYATNEIERITKMAFEAAQTRKGKLTLVDKANVLETSRLWRRVVQKMHQQYQNVEVEYMYVDNAAMQLVLNPSQFDVLLTENMFGDILSDLVSTLAGSLGMLPSASLGDNVALFEPCHGSFPQAAGKDEANPIATILSVAMMYEYFGMTNEAEQVKNAVHWSLKEGLGTSDIFEESISCSCLGDLIAHYIEEDGDVIVNKDYILNAKNCII